MQTKARAIREQSVAEIEKTIEEKQSALRMLRFQMATREAKNYRTNSLLRRDVARLLTVLAEKSAE